MQDTMLNLGHIIYSNCFLPHAGIVTGKTRFPFNLVEGIPSELNRLLYEGNLDVSPSSSIEYAIHPGRYLLLPGFSITSKSKVMSIILKSRVPITDLTNRSVALTSASATSIVLLRILLERFYKVHPVYSSFKQGEEDPFAKADAALFIGDLALRTIPTDDFPHCFDLGALWHERTGLPFVFALWQINNSKNSIDNDLSQLYDILRESRGYGISHLEELAESKAAHFNVPASLLREYWRSFSFLLEEEEQKGLLTFYKHAADLGVIKPITDLCFWKKG